MIVIGADGTEGTVSTPMQLTQRIYSQGLIYAKGWPTRSITFVENGDVTLAPGIEAEPKKNDLIATFTGSVVYCFSEEDMIGKDGRPGVIDLLLKPAMKLLSETYSVKFKKGNGYDSNNGATTEVDTRVPTVPRVGRSEIMSFIDKKDIVVELDQMFKGRLDDDFQDKLQDLIANVKAVPYPKLIGYGLVRNDWKNLRRPNMYMRVGPRTAVRVRKTELKFAKNEWIVQACYMYILAYALRTWLGADVLPDFKLEDWVAYCTMIVGGIAGYGDTDTTQHWTASDIETSISAMPGFGWTKANRYMWANTDVFEEIRKYWVWCTLLGVVCQRIKAPTLNYEIKKAISSNDWMVARRFQDALKPNISGFGSNGTMFFLMPRNNFSYGEQVDLPIPCLVDETNIGPDEGQILRKANNYEDLPPFETVSWKDVTIDRGEVPMGAIDTKSNTQQYVRLHCTTDARIVEITDDTTNYIRKLTQYRFPYEDIRNNSLGRTERFRLWIWGLLANGDKGMKNAYVINSSLGVFNPIFVNYRRGPMDAVLIDKQGTGTVGDQVPRPGSIAVPGPQQSKADLGGDVKPPVPLEKSTEPRRTMETKDGKIVPQATTDKVESEPGNESNNKPGGDNHE